MPVLVLGAKAMEKPTSDHRIVTMPIEAKLIIIVEMVAPSPTSPP